MMVKIDVGDHYMVDYSFLFLLLWPSILDFSDRI